jgi:hypothetical protein
MEGVLAGNRRLPAGTFYDYHTPLAIFFKGKGCRARAPGNLCTG